MSSPATASMPRDSAAGTGESVSVDLKLEVVAVPVADVDRSKRFYAGLGWRLDADFAVGDRFRVVQFTPPGSPGSIHFGTGITSAPPGSAQGLFLVVADIAAARAELVARGAEVSEVFHYRRRSWQAGYQWPGSGRTQLRLLRDLCRSRRERLAAPGDHEPASRPDRFAGHALRLKSRPRDRIAARRDRPRRAREAQRRPT